jgi:hypothetical protein
LDNEAAAARRILVAALQLPMIRASPVAHAGGYRQHSNATRNNIDVTLTIV